MTNLTYSRQTIEMKDGVNYSLSNVKMQKSAMKKNHCVMQSKAIGKEYIVNLDNKFAYEIIN